MWRLSIQMAPCKGEAPEHVAECLRAMAKMFIHWLIESFETRRAMLSRAPAQTGQLSK
jgi:hypothetical protein